MLTLYSQCRHIHLEYMYHIWFNHRGGLPRLAFCILPYICLWIHWVWLWTDVRTDGRMDANIFTSSMSHLCWWAEMTKNYETNWQILWHSWQFVKFYGILTKFKENRRTNSKNQFKKNRYVDGEAIVTECLISRKTCIPWYLQEPTLGLTATVIISFCFRSLKIDPVSAFKYTYATAKCCWYLINVT